MKELRDELRDEELVCRAREGDRPAFERLIERHFGTVYALAYARLAQSEAAEELAQEVFLRAYLFLDDTEGPLPLGAWITRAAHNVASDWARRGQRTSSLVSSVPVGGSRAGVSAGRAGAASEDPAGRGRNWVLRQAIFRLPLSQRDFVLLHCTEGLETREIAELLAVPLATVQAELQRGMISLRGMLEPILRESAQSLGPRPAASERALAVIRRASVLPQSARATLRQWAGAASGPVAPFTPVPPSRVDSPLPLRSGRTSAALSLR